MENRKIQTVWLKILDATPILNKIPVQVDCSVGKNCANIVNETANNLRNGLLSTSDAISNNCVADPENIHERIKQIILIPLTILILGSNIAVLSVLATNRKFHTPAYWLIANLGIADLLVGVVSIGTMITRGNERTLEQCLIRIGFTISCCVCSLLCLMSIAIERYIAITFPLVYTKMVTKMKTTMATALSWFVSLVIGFAPLIGWRGESYGQYCSFLYVLPNDYIIILFVSCVLIPIIVMLVIYGKIYKNVRFHIKRIEAIENLHLERRKTSGLLGISSRTWKSIKTLSAVFGCVLITWLPFLLTTVTQIACGDRTCFLKDIVGTHLLLLGFSNSFLNPIIYAIGTKDFRDKVKYIIDRQNR